MDKEKKEEYRYQFAGMAMQAIIRASWTGTGNEIGNELAELAKKHKLDLDTFIAHNAVIYADALIKELEREEDDK